MSRVLIVAYGNLLRGDDGLAWRAADELEESFSSADVELLRVHQLAPELAEIISRTEAVIFMDAASGNGGEKGQPGEVRWEEIRPAEAGSQFSHHLSPSSVVVLSRQLYGANPRAFSVTLTGENFDPGESLTPVVAAALPAMVRCVEALVKQLLSVASSDNGIFK